jgi:F-type H+-transporting ATPase subunit b
MYKLLRQLNSAVTLVLISAGVTAPSFGADSGAHAGDGEDGGAQLPQFNPETFTSQLFWLAVAFGIAYLVFSNKILPEISGVFEKRHERIVSDRETAERLSREAEEIHQAYEESLANAREEAQRLMNETKQAIKDKTEKEHKAFRDKYDQETRALEDRLEHAKQNAMQDINDIVADLATQSADKIAGLSLSKDEADRIVASVVSQNTDTKAA